MSLSALVGYDGSPSANAAIEAGAALFPDAHGWITYIWGPPFASDKLRRRLHARAESLDELIAMVEHEGEQEAQRLLQAGVTLARAAGWDAEPLLERTWGGEGLRLAKAAVDVDADLVIVGSRGLGGAQALLGSVSDLVVHHSRRPTLVIPYPLLAAESEALQAGPVVVGWDGSKGAAGAFETAASLFPERELLLVSVSEGESVSPPADKPADQNRKILQVNVDRTEGFRHRAVSDALIAVARDRDAALVVVGSRGRSAAREILLGSVAMGTLHQCPRPVMVIPDSPAAR